MPVNVDRKLSFCSHRKCGKTDRNCITFATNYLGRWKEGSRRPTAAPAGPGGGAGAPGGEKEGDSTRHGRGGGHGRTERQGPKGREGPKGGPRGEEAEADL